MVAHRGATEYRFTVYFQSWFLKTRGWLGHHKSTFKWLSEFIMDCNYQSLDDIPGTDPFFLIRGGGGPNSTVFISDQRKSRVRKNWIYKNQFLLTCFFWKKPFSWYFFGWFLFETKAKPIFPMLFSCYIDMSKTKIFWIVLEGLVSQQFLIEIRILFQNHFIPIVISHANAIS